MEEVKETVPTEISDNTENTNKRALETNDLDSTNKKIKVDTETKVEETSTTSEVKEDNQEDDEEADEDELDKIEKESESISTTTTTEETTTTTTTGENKRRGNKPPPVRPPKLSKEELVELQNKTKVTTDESRKKKVAIILGYSGTNYAGMQKNPGLKTIEEELEHALFRTGGISPDNMYYQQKVDWVRCARTDKGVSAIRNVVSLKMEMGPPDFDGMKDALNKELPNDIRVFHIMRVNNSYHAKNAVDARSYIYVTPTHVFEPKFAKKNSSSDDNNSSSNWKFTSDTLSILNKVLSFYLGNHRFHNYTSRKESNDVSVFRKIISFVCSEPFILEGVEMVSINVVGESFMLHQIRKMIGCLISFIRKGMFEDCENRDQAFNQIKAYINSTFEHKPLNLPMAPGAGLLLDYCIFNEWNKKNSSIHGELKIENEHVEDFKKTIYREIAKLESSKQEFKNWIEKNLDPYQLPYELMDEIIKNPPPAPGKKYRPPSTNPNRMSKRERRDLKVQSKMFERDPKNQDNRQSLTVNQQMAQQIKINEEVAAAAASTASTTTTTPTTSEDVKTDSTTTEK
ncbi:hypothetical protein RB653_009567 [Dictyostelium firmibasis]|uniref:Pseudouridine synthase I TruA alpha/beta domain-containing protein n=1 Tax=Dictyostelium firmibasis TaxID=79012 RepID=A0AAN7TUA7_9MYCE